MKVKSLLELAADQLKVGELATEGGAPPGGMMSKATKFEPKGTRTTTTTVEELTGKGSKPTPKPSTAAKGAPKTPAKPRTPDQELKDFNKMLKDEGGGPVKADGERLELGPHGAASQNRQALGVSGKDVQSAHDAPQSIMKQVPGYNPDHALTVLMERGVHSGMDRFWKEAFMALRSQGRTTATGEEIEDIVAASIRNAADLTEGRKASLIARLGDELREFGVKPTQQLVLPYPNIKPEP